MVLIFPQIDLFRHTHTHIQTQMHMKSNLRVCPPLHIHTHILTRQHARTLSAAGKSPAARRPANCRWLQRFHQVQWRKERREERGGDRKRKVINKSRAERRRNWLSNLFLFIRLWFVFWLGRAALRMGGIKGIRWWMKFVRSLIMKGGIKGNPIDKPICFLTNEWNLNRKISIVKAVSWALCTPSYIITTVI